MPHPRGRMAGRGETQRPGHLVEHHRAERHQLLGPALRRQHHVELLHGLAGIAVLAEEHPEEVLDLEGGDRGLDAVAADVTDDRRQAGQRRRGEVVEVAGHGAGARLVDVTDLEALDVGQVGGGQPLRPPHGRQLLLGQDLLGPPLEQRPLLGQASRGQEPRPVPQRDGDRHQHEEERKLEPGVGQERRDEARSTPAASTGSSCGGPCRTPSGPAPAPRRSCRGLRRPARCAGRRAGGGGWSGPTRRPPPRRPRPPR